MKGDGREMMVVLTEEGKIGLVAQMREGETEELEEIREVEVGMRDPVEDVVESQVGMKEGRGKMVILEA